MSEILPEIQKNTLILLAVLLFPYGKIKQKRKKKTITKRKCITQSDNRVNNNTGGVGFC